MHTSNWFNLVVFKCVPLKAFKMIDACIFHFMQIYSCCALSWQKWKCYPLCHTATASSFDIISIIYKNICLVIQFYCLQPNISYVCLRNVVKPRCFLCTTSLSMMLFRQNASTGHDECCQEWSSITHFYFVCRTRLGSSCFYTNSNLLEQMY